MKHTISLLALLCCVAACTPGTPSRPQAQVVISLDETCGDTLLLQRKSLTQYGTKPTEDTLYRTDGYFTYTQPEADTALLTLTPTVALYPTLRGFYQRPHHRSIGLVVHPGSSAYVEGSYDQQQLHYTVAGSDIDAAWLEVRNLTADKEQGISQLHLQIASILASQAPNMDSVYYFLSKEKVLQEDIQLLQIAYVKTHPQQPLSLYLLANTTKDTIEAYKPLLSEHVSQGPFRHVLQHQLKAMAAALPPPPPPPSRVHSDELVKALHFQIGDTAPAFDLPTLAGRVTQASFPGKYVVLDFWTTWCKPCIGGFPKMKTYYQRYQDQLEMVGVLGNGDEETWRKAADKYQLPWTNAHSTAKTEGTHLSDVYGVQALPTKVIIDPDGVIVGMFVGESDFFYQELDQLLGEF